MRSISVLFPYSIHTANFHCTNINNKKKTHETITQTKIIKILLLPLTSIYLKNTTPHKHQPNIRESQHQKKKKVRKKEKNLNKRKDIKEREKEKERKKEREKEIDIEKETEREKNGEIERNRERDR